MSTNSLLKAGIFAIIIVTAFFASWEIFWRSKGYTINYDDGKILWADKRARVYDPADKATVFIGSSRIKYDLDIPTWEKITGTHAIQLAIEGSSPLPVLEDLASDEKFKGRLVIDVTEGLFFGGRSRQEKEPLENIKYFKDVTPSDRAGFQVGKRLESQFVFLNKDYLSLNGMLSRLPIPKRKGVFEMPYFPPEFSHTTFDRQAIIQPAMLKDSNITKQVIGNWLFFAELGKKEPPPPKEHFIGIMNSVKGWVDKIRSRGGQVIFVRTPSSGPFWEMESKVMSRDKLWEPLLAVTRSPGIHFKDYPETSGYICPEWSHLKHDDAIDYTKHLAKHLEQKGWMFPNTSKTTSFLNH
jgi:hypothetical protein